MWILLQDTIMKIRLECMKPKWAKDYTYHKEKMLLCKQAEKGVPLQVEQADWLKDTDKEIDEPELEAHYSFMAKIQEVLPVESGSDAEPLKKADQNAEECDDERAVLANLISNLKLDTDENKKIQKQLKKANTTLSHELQECKSALEEYTSSLRDSNRTRDRYLVALHDKEVELEKMTKVIKGEVEKIKDIKVKDVLLACDTQLEVFNNEVNRLSRIHDDSKHDDDMGYHPSDVAFIECELKDEALRNKAIMEGLINEDDNEPRYKQKRQWNMYTNYDDAY
ncbi:hypothetical protein Tco_0941725 [Tanacetum coccineum]|uniref:Uncharacterized protein n=1 Tax=Tanacetum coccineum TaxID=301880 RepID=A0ABQ5DS69_9ASTR